MNLIFNGNHPDEIERIVSSVVDELDSLSITISRKDNVIVIGAPESEITNILDKIKSSTKIEKLVVIEPNKENENLPDIKLAHDIATTIFEFSVPDVEKISDLISCMVPPPSRKFISDNKSKYANQVQRKLYDGYAHTRFNQQKQLQRQIRTKHK